MDRDKFLKAVVSLYGENWPAPFSAATGIALRTCQRVRKALDAGETDIRLAGMIAGLEEVSAATLDLLGWVKPSVTDEAPVQRKFIPEIGAQFCPVFRKNEEGVTELFIPQIATGYWFLKEGPVALICETKEGRSYLRIEPDRSTNAWHILDEQENGDCTITCPGLEETGLRFELDRLMPLETVDGEVVIGLPDQSEPLDDNDATAELETAYWRLVAAANKALGDPTNKAARDQFLEAVSSRVVDTGGAVAIEESGMLSIVKPPQSLFGVDLSAFVGRGAPVIVVPVETALDLPAMQKCARQLLPSAEVYSSWAVVGLPCEGITPAVIVRPSTTNDDAIRDNANRLAEGHQAIWPDRDVVVFFYDQTGQLCHMGKPALHH